MNGLMIQGTSSGSGKSFIVTGLCRLLAGMGIHVCPFKSQNMSNNASITHDGLEISTAQAVQAQAAGLRPEYFMNPILLKPRHECSSEVILNGRVYAHNTKGYREFTRTAGIEAVRDALRHIERNFDAVIIEGAGSPAEINLNANEIVNMRIAREADVPVVLVADVDRGGSLAAVAGTLELLGDDRRRVKGIIFNMFRGDIGLFTDAVRWTESYTGVKVLGVVPFVRGVNIPGEDSLNLKAQTMTAITPGKIAIGIMNFPGISNFSDFDAFTHEPDVETLYIDDSITVRDFNALDALILPGTKNTFAALGWLKASGFDAMIRGFRGFIFGICGGLQVMGSELIDDSLHENDTLKRAEGLGILPAVTSFNATSKITHQVSVTIYGTSESVSGYELHLGRTEYVYGDGFRPLFRVEGMNEGIIGHDMRRAGTYLHGVFSSDNFRALWLNTIRRAKNYGEHAITDTLTANDNSYNSIARVLSRSLDIPGILRLIHREDTTLQPQ